jgi:hypothetical protein
VWMTAVLCSVGLTYVTFLVHIWIDTQMIVKNIATAYGGMEYIELTNHAHIYYPYYAIYLFLLPTALFMFTSYSEKFKVFFAAFPFVIIFCDIASMYLIPYASKTLFAYVLWTAGTLLALSFLTMFVLNCYDIWFRKNTSK